MAPEWLTLCEVFDASSSDVGVQNTFGRYYIWMVFRQYVVFDGPPKYSYVQNIFGRYHTWMAFPPYEVFYGSSNDTFV